MMDREPQDKEDRESSGLLPEIKDEGLKKPPWWRDVLPYLVAAAILGWIFHDMELDKFLGALREARLYMIFPAMLLFTAVYAGADIASYGMSYRWFVLPGITVPEMAAARLGAYLFHVLYTPLSTVANLAYLRRHKGAPVLWALSANAFTNMHDLFSIDVVVTAALILNLHIKAAPGLGPEWLIPAGVPWAVAAGYALYWFTPVREMRVFRRVTYNPILRSCRLAGGRQYLTVLLSRLAVAVSGVAAHAVLLYAFDIRAPLPMVLVVAPIMIGVSFMPVSGAGFGGPQLAALILLPYAYGDKALITAYSMSFSVLFTVGRSLIGIFFFPAYSRGIRSPVPRITRDPISGEPV